MEILRDNGAFIDYDPYVPEFPKLREHNFKLTSIGLTPENIAGYDLFLLATDHSASYPQMLKDLAVLIVDARGGIPGT
ncbi:MAG: hypothetical protein V1706_02385 [Pseudomonadota bacterium]